MDDLVAEEVTSSDPPEGAQLQRKENEFSLKPENNNTLECQEMRIPGEDNYSPSSRQEFLEMFDSHSVDRNMRHVNGLEHQYNSLGFMEDAGFTVEELTVRNCNNPNLAILDTSNNQGKMQARQNSWQHLYQLASGSGSGSSRVNTAFRDNGQKAVSDNHYEVVEELTNTGNRGGKGVICKGPYHASCHVEPRNLNRANVVDGSMPSSLGGGSMAASDPTLSLDANIFMSSSNGENVGPRSCGSDHDGINLREWLKTGRPKANKVECMNIFREIVDLVDHFHSQGVALHGLRPFFFQLLPSNQVKYVGLLVQKEMSASIMDEDISHLEISSIRKKLVEQEFSSVGLSAKKQKISQNTRLQWPQFPATSYVKRETMNTSCINITGLPNRSDAFDECNPGTKHGTRTKSSSPHMRNAAQQLTSISDHLEEKWYISPEELSEGSCTALSNIYNLGVLLFELLAQFDSNSALAAAMSNLRHRILPPNFLSENAKEAGFCLWLLHPDPSSRPTTREILQSEVVNGLQEVSVEESSSSVDQEDAELELLLHFLTSMKEKKQKAGTKLMETIRFLEADVEEVERRHCSRKPLIDHCLYNESLNGRKNTLFLEEDSRSEGLSPISSVPSSNVSRLMRNIDQLESAYFSMRSRIQYPETDSTIRTDKDLLRNRKNWCVATKDEEKETATDRLGAIFDGLCRYARYSKFEVRGILRNGDFNSSSNVICSLSFDRDEDYFAAAGISKKIKIFEFNAFFDDSVDIHYPAIEMSNKSKISCVCWNNYIKNYLASTDYDGVIKLWDASTGQEFAQYNEHERRAWSVDFSQVYPTKLASGSDDGSVKLWSINEKKCLGTIKNVANANVCCVQFSAHSTHLLAFGSADFRTYCYDLRNTKIPWCVLAGHEKAVSYVKFLDSETLVSASTDNTLKLWDLNKSSISGPSTNACSLTLGGHTNEKNFVGLSVSDGYITCGSETNEVYAYYRSLPMPITSHKFGSIDRISGTETDDDNGQFVSSVCWRGKSDMVVAANSSGCIKVLQIV
ncbi:protein SPA1-RELATED 2 [Prunus yedoensis var. nudiflora]|uniref:Protein SPA1-RELATED 2 n=1 Tax=Prunus yedoensis var. nudiflora TaxID=2094558 RepID=A0A314UY89_PRUYE|nr:protein SPA1-RELATED 2 [Prunus yedoensis var. nudiflora]